MSSVSTVQSAHGTKHIPVLLQEVVKYLDLKEGETLLDGTIGSAGHSMEVARYLNREIRIIGLDRDRDAIKRSERELEQLGVRHILRQESFRNLDKILEELEIDKVDAILFDLGISSEQLEDEGRGFSFQEDRLLDMRMDRDGPTAADILNGFTEQALELIIRGFGEEKYSRKIAKHITERRIKNPFKTTFDLVDVINKSVPKNYEKGRINPATRTFQALRIATNEELSALEDGLAKGFQALSSGGRLVVISFHSLEDRIVKRFFQSKAKENMAIIITKKPITPSTEEVGNNHRSRSAKLRTLEKV